MITILKLLATLMWEALALVVKGLINPSSWKDGNDVK